MAFYPNSEPRTLSDSDRQILEVGSAISSEVIDERGVWTINRPGELPEGYNERQRRRAPGMVFQLHRPNGATATVFRPRTPYPDKPNWKYEQMPKSSGGGNCLDVHPWCHQYIGDLSVPVIFCEGTKKADALVTAFRRAGIPVVVVCIVGVWNWVEDGCKPIADMFDIPLRGRSVTIIFDSDARRKWQVQLAEKRLAEHAAGRGASVYVTYLQDLPDGSKCGADDFFAQGGTLTELRLLTRRYDPRDSVRIRLTRDERLRAGVEDLERRFWDEKWSGMGGATDRDVYLKLIEAAMEYGKVHPDGIRVERAQGPLALESKVSTRTLWKSLNRLEKRGLIYRDNEDRKPDECGAFVLRASVSHNRRQKATEDNVITSSEVSYARDLHLRAPRLRWSQPQYTPRRGLVTGTRKVRQGVKAEPRPAIKRLGKIRGAILDALDAAGGTLTLRELADTLHRSRPRDIRRRNLPMLEAAGIVAVSEAGDVVSLAPDWLARLEEQRRLGKETDSRVVLTYEDGRERVAAVEGMETIAKRRYEIKRDAYREYLGTKKSNRGPSEASVESIKHSHDARDRWLAEEAAKPEAEPTTYLTAEQSARVDTLVQQGMKEEFAITEVLRTVSLFEKRPEPEPERKLPKKVGGVFVHGPECDCWLCDEGEGAA
jgi:hypothetical protein